MTRKMAEIEKVDYNSVAKIILEWEVTKDEWIWKSNSGNRPWKTRLNDENMNQWKFSYEERVRTNFHYNIEENMDTAYKMRLIGNENIEIGLDAQWKWQPVFCHMTVK